MLTDLIDPFTAEVDFSARSVWAHARADYLAGETAQRVCERYDLALSTFRDRAKREGWRRTDIEAEWGDAEPVDAEPRALDPAPPTADMIEAAWRAVADALNRGRAYEARAFLRLVRELREEAGRERAQAAMAAREAAKAATTVPVLDDPDSESKGAGAEDLAAAEADLNTVRTEIARLQALARSGRATPRDLLALRDAKALLRHSEATLAAYREVDGLMGSASGPPPPRCEGG
jgi:hypothetical protein